MTSDLKKCFIEFLGTFIITFTILSCALFEPSITKTAIATGFAVIAAVYMGGPISGAHFNPAISLAVFLSGKMGSKKTFLYCVFQLFGAAYAALLMLLLSANFSSGTIPQYKELPLIFGETIFTSILILVFLFTNLSKRAQHNNYYGLAIGATYIAGILTFGNLCLAVFNPAISLAMGLFSLAPFKMVGITIGIQLVAALISCYLFKLLNTDNVEDVEIVGIDDFIQK